MDVIGAKQRRAELIRKRRELIEGVEARGGKLGATERELMAAWEAEGKRLADLLDEEELKFKRSAEIALGAGPARKDAYGQLGPGEVRTLAPDQRMSDLPTMELPDGIRASDLSLGRIIRSMVRGDWTGAEAEARAVMVGGTGSLGGVLVPEALSLNVLDLARAQACCVKAGATTIPMESATLTIARQATDPTGYWRGENVAITESSGSFDWVKLNANALACLVRLSVELVEDAANVVGIIDAAIAQSLGLKLDYACMLGSGVSPEPCGISETDGINNVEMGTGDGLALSSFDPFSQAVQLIREANGEPGALIWAPRTAGEVDRLKDTTNQPLKPPTSFEALRKYVSSQIPIDQTVGTSTDCSTVFLGDFAQLFVGMRKNLIIEAARMGDSDSVSKMQVIIRAYLRADARVVRPSHFTTITGIREG